MELWQEYLERHKLPIIIPQQPFLEEVVSFYIPASPPVEHKVWAFFLMNNSHFIANYSFGLEEEVNNWCDELLVITRTNMPSVKEQREIIFRKLPHLECLWNRWQNNFNLSTRNSVTDIFNML